MFHQVWVCDETTKKCTDTETYRHAVGSERMPSRHCAGHEWRKASHQESGDYVYHDALARDLIPAKPLISHRIEYDRSSRQRHSPGEIKRISLWLKYVTQHHAFDHGNPNREGEGNCQAR